MTVAALAVRELSVWLETPAGRRQAVDRVSFSIGRRQALGLAGESGCGKTLMALAIMGLLPEPGFRVSSAGIEIDGKDVSALSGRRRRAILGRDIAMIFQQPGTALDPVFTIGQQLGAVYRRHLGGSATEARRAVLEALESVGFGDCEEVAAAYPHRLSGGMRQLAMIAMATICKPAVIIADEPTTALDGATRGVILQQFERLRREHGAALLLISHDLSVVRQCCSEVMIMYCGRLLEMARSQDLFSHARHPYSAGLLACIPQISAKRPPPIQAIPGQVPALARLPPGCHFADRCTRAEPACRQSVPRIAPGQGTGVACLRPL